ncbi:MarR family transcriptional regulator [Candidatus Nitrososphaera sp. FF02]|uniref:MarR family transcriptional regulator n=1 Tax=Candidatus Nitrososphaera sp. FF02 TaxID=3398226 RepID=UPI0039E77EB1
MGGNKSKPAGKDKGTVTGPGGEIKTAPKEEKKKPQQKARLAVTIDENQGMKAIQSMKAITVQSVAKAAGVKISVANSLIRTLEAKGVVKKVGGYSGHRVYAKVK